MGPALLSQLHDRGSLPWRSGRGCLLISCGCRLQWERCCPIRARVRPSQVVPGTEVKIYLARAYLREDTGDVSVPRVDAYRAHKDVAGVCRHKRLEARYDHDQIRYSDSSPIVLPYLVQALDVE